jgi:hypothetical protein
MNLFIVRLLGLWDYCKLAANSIGVSHHGIDCWELSIGVVDGKLPVVVVPISVAPTAAQSTSNALSDALCDPVPDTIEDTEAEAADDIAQAATEAAGNAVCNAASNAAERVKA